MVKMRRRKEEGCAYLDSFHDLSTRNVRPSETNGSRSLDLRWSDGLPRTTLSRPTAKHLVVASTRWGRAKEMFCFV